jgi:hypothetical protein
MAACAPDVAALRGVSSARDVRGAAAVPGGGNLVPCLSQRLARRKARERCGRQVPLTPVRPIERSEEEAEHHGIHPGTASRLDPTGG